MRWKSSSILEYGLIGSYEVIFSIEDGQKRQKSELEG